MEPEEKVLYVLARRGGEADRHELVHARPASDAEVKAFGGARIFVAGAQQGSVGFGVVRGRAEDFPAYGNLGTLTLREVTDADDQREIAALQGEIESARRTLERARQALEDHLAASLPRWKRARVPASPVLP